MLLDIVGLKLLGDYKLLLSFEDGKQGEVDISKIVQFRGVFEPLKDQAYFSKVKLNNDIGTIYWDNGADISPECLYEYIDSQNSH